MIKQKEYTVGKYKSTTTKIGKVRRDISNKQKWVFEVYFSDKIKGKVIWRKYPNIISARYLSKGNAEQAFYNYLKTGNFNSYDEQRR